MPSPTTTVDGNLVVAGSVTTTMTGIGVTPSQNFELRETTQTYAWRVTATSSGLLVQHDRDTRGLVADLHDMDLWSSGDGVHVTNLGGVPQTYTGVKGGSTGLGTVIPYYMDSSPPSARNGTVVNNYSVAHGMYMRVEPTGDVYGANVVYSGRQAAVIINNQPDGVPSGNGQGLKILHNGPTTGADITNWASASAMYVRSAGTGGGMLVQDYASGAGSVVTLTTRNVGYRNAVLLSIGNEPYGRVAVTYDGHFRMGSGQARVDCDLTRGAPHQWVTPDAFITRGGAVTKTTGGPPTDTAFQRKPVDGTVVLDTTNQRLYVRTGGAWRYAQL